MIKMRNLNRGISTSHESTVEFELTHFLDEFIGFPIEKFESKYDL